MASTTLLLLLTWCLINISAPKASHAEEKFYSFETVSKSVDDGQQRVNELFRTSVDSSARSLQPQVQHHKSVEPSQLTSGHNSIEYHKNQAQALRNRNEMVRQFMGEFSKHGGFRRGFLTRPRTVEPPALSVDSGGRSRAGQRLANSISKIFHVEQGHYSDIYNRIDGRE